MTITQATLKKNYDYLLTNLLFTHSLNCWGRYAFGTSALLVINSFGRLL